MFKRFVFLMVLISVLILPLNQSFAYEVEELPETFIVSKDPIHPYIHELMNYHNSRIRIIDSMEVDITDVFKEKLYPMYKENRIEDIMELMEISDIIFLNTNINRNSNSIKRIGIVPFSHVQKWIQSQYNLEVIYSVKNDIFIDNDRFSGYTTPVWTLEYSYPEPISLVSINLSPSIINSGYTYRVGINFRLSYYGYLYPPYNEVVYYHYI